MKLHFRSGCRWVVCNLKCLENTSFSSSAPSQSGQRYLRNRRHTYMKQWIVGAGLLLGLVCIGRVNGWSLVREHPVDELRVEGPYAALTARYVQELLNQLKDA